jgi:cytochrome c553
MLLAVLLPFVLLGVAVIFVAFSGGPGKAREAYLTKGGRLFRVTVPLLYLVLGVGVPAIVIASRGEAEGAKGRLRDVSLSSRDEQGKTLFRETCASCHNLDAVNARGVTGPDLDEIGQVTKSRVLNAIRIGGTGDKRMPAGLLQGQDAEDVAGYVSKVAGR